MRKRKFLTQICRKRFAARYNHKKGKIRIAFRSGKECRTENQTPNPGEKIFEKNVKKQLTNEAQHDIISERSRERETK